VSLLAGLIAGVIIAALYLLTGHFRIETPQLTVAGNGTLALATASVLVPLAILWGWTWVSDRWSGRSGPRLLLFTLGLALTTAAAFPLDSILSASAPDRIVFDPSVSIVAVDGVLWIVPVVAIAAILYWLFGSGKLPVGLPTLAFGYLIGLPLGLFFPPAAMGAVAGTAAGHAWREPGARALIVVLVIFIMLVAAVELPLAAATVDSPLFK
jgi:MFS family permease